MNMTELMVKITDLALALNAEPINQYPDCWECKIDNHWTIAVNGHRVPKMWNDIVVQPFHVYVEFCGFPAGMISAFGGIIAAGGMANEDTLIAAIETRIEKTPSTCPAG